MALHKITAISQFAMTYFIEADSLEHAMDEFTMKDAGGKYAFDEAAQEHLGEVVVSAETIKRKHFDRWLDAEVAKGNRSGASHWMGDQLIRKVQYAEATTTESKVFRDMGTSLILGTPEIE